MFVLRVLLVFAFRVLLCVCVHILSCVLLPIRRKHSSKRCTESCFFQIIFLYLMKHYQNHLTGSKQTDIHSRSTQSVRYNNRNTGTILFPAGQKTVTINGMLYRRVLLEQTHLPAMRMPGQNQIGIRHVRIFGIVGRMGQQENKIIGREML